jgi:hypothetical protein
MTEGKTMTDTERFLKAADQLRNIGTMACFTMITQGGQERPIDCKCYACSARTTLRALGEPVNDLGELVGRKQRGHNHAEAFAVMRYVAAGGKHELIWNSRDGVTPFVTRIDGVDLQHVDWGNDWYAPAYVPPIGSWIFVDMTAELAQRFAREYVDKYWDRGDGQSMVDHDYYSKMTKEEAIAEKAAAMFEQPGEPARVKVTAEMQAVFKERAHQAQLEGAPAKA